MALQAWLPLNKNLNNCGLVQSTPTNNGVVLENGGYFGKTCSFNGSSYIDTGFAESFGTGDFTISVWMYLTQTAGKTYQCIVGNKAQAAASLGCAIYWNQSQKKFLWSTADGSNATEIWTVNTFDSIIYNSWHHIVMVRNTSDAKKGYFYIDGVRQEIASVPAIRNVTSTTAIRIGAMPSNAAYFFTGKLNDVRLYDSALSEDDIKELYEAKRYHFSAQWRKNDLVTFGDASGVGPLIRQTGHTVEIKGGSAYFSGTTSSYIEFDGLNVIGGSLSLWYKVDAAPSGNQVLFMDPVAKMAFGYLGSGAFIVSTTSQNRYLSTGATIGSWNHVAISYDSTGKAVNFWLNGVSPSQGAAEYWSTAGTVASIGLRIKNGTKDAPFKGYINDVRIFGKQLTVDEARALYLMGPGAIDEPVWMRLVHHNAPNANLFTSANCTNCTSENLFSRLCVFNNNDALKRRDGFYWFMAKEKLTATAAEQTYIWKQASNPTASTVVGYSLVSQTNNPGRDFGLVHQTTRTQFDNKNQWWCATGCYTAYSTGIPGYGGVISNGCLDFYARVDNLPLPSGYTELEYVESSGSQYIDTGIKPCMNTIRCVCDMVPLNGNDTAFFGTRGTYYLFYKVSSNYFWPTSQCETIQGTLQIGNKYHVDWNKGTLEVTGSDGVYQKGVRSNSTQDSSNMYIFNFNPTDSRSTTARLYNFQIYVSDVPVRSFVPCKRNNDGVVGLYDLVTDAFFAPSGTLIAGPAV